MIDKIIGIYQIKNIVNNRIYIGSTTDIKRRFYTHTLYLNKNKHTNYYLQSDWNKFGDNNFVFEILEQTESISKLRDREQHYIDTSKCLVKRGGYNIIEKAYIPPSWLGKRHKEETKKKIGKPKIGKSRPRWIIEKLRIHNTGRALSDETKKKLSQANKGRKKPFGFAEKLREVNKGKRPSDNTLNAAAKVNRRFTDKQVIEIRNKRSTGLCIKDIALIFEAGTMTIWRVLTAKGPYKKVSF